LRLGHTEDSMISRIVNFEVPIVIDNQSPGEYCIPKIILCAN
jgi:hypothetical protein